MYLLILGLTLAALYAIVIGANDMANIIGVLIGGRVTSYKVASIVFATSVIMGSLLQGYMVMKTLGRGIVRELDVYGAIVASTAAILWVSVATRMGLPVSTSQSAACGVLGVGLAYVLKTGNIGFVNYGIVSRIILSWTVSPLLAMIVTALVYFTLEKVHRQINVNEKVIKSLAILLAGFDGYAFGANDVANATGVYLAVVGASTVALGLSTSIALALFGAFFIVLGGVVMGKRVVETVGYRITKLDEIGSISSSLISSTSTWLFTTIPYMLFGYGMPVSTTYITVGTVMGIGVAKHRSFRKGLNLKIVAMIVLSWMVTLPVTVLISMVTYYSLSILFIGR